MKKHTIILLVILQLGSLRAFSVNDNYTETNTYAPTGGSLSNNLSADGNSANNNGSISSSSSATANNLHSNITGVQRFDTSNNQLGMSSSNSSVGNINNTSRGGDADSYSGGNTLNNSLTNTSSSSSGGNTLSNGQGQESNNTNSTTGNTTTTNVNENTTVSYPRQAPPLIQTQITPVNNNGYNAGFTTPFGGFSGGISKVDKSAKALNLSQSAFIDEQARDQMIKNTEKACLLVTQDQCDKLKVIMLRKLGVSMRK